MLNSDTDSKINEKKKIITASRVFDPDPVFEIRLVSDPIVKIWSDPDPDFLKVGSGFK